MAKHIDARAIQGMLYGIYKALHHLAGASAGAVMRKAAPDILEGLSRLGVDFRDVNSLEKLEERLRDTMVGAGCCDDMQFSMTGNKLRVAITNCAFFELTMELQKEGIPPFGCPFAALTIGIAEKNLHKSGRVTLLQPVPGGRPGDTELVVELHDRVS
jgi:hypothetical protein